MKKISILIIFILGFIICFIEYFVCLNYDFSKSNPLNKTNVKTEDDFIGEYEFSETEEHSYGESYVDRDFYIELKKNQECIISINREINGGLSITTGYKADVCKYEYNNLKNEIIFEFDDQTNYNSRVILELEVKDGGIVYDDKILKKIK